MKNFTGKRVAITGAGTGIGAALAVALAREGADLALCGRRLEPLQRTAEAARAASGREDLRITLHSVDVADRAAVEGWAAAVEAELGPAQLLINNAGVAIAATAEAIDYADFARVMDINFWGVVHGCKAFLPQLRRAEEAHIVNVSSVFGLLGIPGQSAYNASKFAVRGYSEALAQELALAQPAIGVTCVHPGGVKTDIAKAATIDPSMRELLGVDADPAEIFERLFQTSPEAAAKAILRAVRKRQRRVLVGVDARLMDSMARGLPAGYQRITQAGTRLLRYLPGVDKPGKS